MVFFNYATMQMAAKIVYYGPGLCGKTTNLHVIYSRTAPTSRGEMVSLETETDRTLFFDLLPIDVGIIGGFKTRLQLYTVPGQVFYNTTRKLVLKGVDGVVFVADSQTPMLEANRESFRNLGENLAEIGLNLSEVPTVLQYNKRDLSNILSLDELHAALNPDRSLEWFESSARNGAGVFETLKGISKLTLRSLKSKMTGELKRPTSFSASGRMGVVSVEAPPPLPTPRPAPQASDDVFPDEGGAGAGAEATLAAAPAPSPEPAAAAIPSAAMGDGQDDQEISFAQTAAAAPQAEAEAGEVKHVRVRSSVDILSELDKLRKLATQKPASPSDAFPAVSHPTARGQGFSIDDLLASGGSHKRDVTRSFDLTVSRAALNQSRQVTVVLRFNGGPGGKVSGEEREVRVDLPGGRELQKLLLSLRFNVQAE